LLQGGEAAVLVDGGPGPAALLRFLEEEGAAFARGLEVFVTHPHGDHIGGLPAFRGISHTIHAPENARLPGAKACRLGETLEIPPFSIRILDLDGHWPGAVGFFVEGLETPVCAVGDALFAGSVGGTPNPGRHRVALERIREEILSLPPATILLPGHGPPTTVALERRHNPFFP
jgi:glyoxylase-like metal-dependent hydrolase (beta-lactamase superfamily II)